MSRPACVGRTYGNEYDVYPCDVAECPACKPRREAALLPPLPGMVLGIYTTAGRFVCASCRHPGDAVKTAVVPGDSKFRGTDCFRCGEEVNPDDSAEPQRRGSQR